VSAASILLVEDSPDDEALTVRALRMGKLVNEIQIAHDGVEALEILRDTSRPLPQLVLLDLKLPRVDGIEVLREVRKAERTRWLPVVVLTSSNEERDLVASYELGANSFIRKPVDFEQFSEAIEQLGLYWLVLNQVPRSR
jgi:two-component system, response regulator